MFGDDKAIAHVREDGSIHDLEQHLREVAKRASGSANLFGAGDWAYLAGIWHDLGKNQARFQRYIRTASGLDRIDAHIEGAPNRGRVDHSTPGALYAVEKHGKLHGTLLAYLIAGHHAGLPDGIVHLSALMCGQHRADVIDRIKRQLKDGEAVRVVSTQLVEAGVDLDFPIGYRALAGLDSIAQAAGRCNREGRLDELGRVRVFVPPGQNMGLIYKAELTTRELLHGFDDDLLEPELFGRFFQLFYRHIDPDKARIEDLLLPDGGLSIAFRTAAEKFRLIDDGYQLPIFVAYDDWGSQLIDQLPHTGPERWIMRQLQRYSVNNTRVDHQRLTTDGFIKEILPGIHVQCLQGLYDMDIGVITNSRMAPGDYIT